MHIKQDHITQRIIFDLGAESKGQTKQEIKNIFSPNVAIVEWRIITTVDRSNQSIVETLNTVRDALDEYGVYPRYITVEYDVYIEPLAEFTKWMVKNSHLFRFVTTMEIGQNFDDQHAFDINQILQVLSPSVQTLTLKNILYSPELKTIFPLLRTAKIFQHEDHVLKWLQQHKIQHLTVVDAVDDHVIQQISKIKSLQSLKLSLLDSGVFELQSWEMLQFVTHFEILGCPESGMETIPMTYLSCQISKDDYIQPLISIIGKLKRFKMLYVSMLEKRPHTALMRALFSSQSLQEISILTSIRILDQLMNQQQLVIQPNVQQLSLNTEILSLQNAQWICNHFPNVTHCKINDQRLDVIEYFIKNWSLQTIESNFLRISSNKDIQSLIKTLSSSKTLRFVSIMSIISTGEGAPLKIEGFESKTIVDIDLSYQTLYFGDQRPYNIQEIKEQCFKNWQNFQFGDLMPVVLRCMQANKNNPIKDSCFQIAVQDVAQLLPTLPKNIDQESFRRMLMKLLTSSIYTDRYDRVIANLQQELINLQYQLAPNDMRNTAEEDARLKQQYIHKQKLLQLAWKQKEKILKRQIELFGFPLMSPDERRSSLVKVKRGLKRKD